MQIRRFQINSPKQKLYKIMLFCMSLTASCSVHKTSNLIKNVQCSDVQVINFTQNDTSIYRVSGMVKRKSIHIVRGDVIFTKFSDEICEIIELLNTNKYYSRPQVTALGNNVEKSELNMQIFFKRTNDEFVVDPVQNSLIFYDSKQRLEIGRDITMFNYSSKRYFKNEILDLKIRELLKKLM